LKWRADTDLLYMMIFQIIIMDYTYPAHAKGPFLATR